MVPIFLDPDRRMERPELPRGQTLRFVTEEDYPPFNYIGPDGALAGFHLDLARAICAELALACTIQPRHWEKLLPALDHAEAEAVLAGHRITPELRRSYPLSLPLLRVPARFAARRQEITEVTPGTLAGKSVAVIGGSAHEAYLNAFFPALRVIRVEKAAEMFTLLQNKGADLAFADGVTLSFWLTSPNAESCCALVGGAFTESRFFGEGSTAVLPRGRRDLQHAMDYAIWRLVRDGRYGRIYLKHFPLSLY